VSRYPYSWVVVNDQGLYLLRCARGYSWCDYLSCAKRWRSPDAARIVAGRVCPGARVRNVGRPRRNQFLLDLGA